MPGVVTLRITRKALWGSFPTQIQGKERKYQFTVSVEDDEAE